MRMKKNGSLPVLFVTGFLGSGKTTFINRLIRAQRRYDIGVIVNEIGEAGIESSLVRHAKSSLVELPSSCLCCALPGALGSSIKTLRNQVPGLEALIIEASGLSHPASILREIREKQEEWGVQLESALCLADPASFKDHAARYPQVLEQARFSDYLLVNPKSAFKAERLTNYLEEIQALAPGSRTLLLDADPDWNYFWDLGFQEGTKKGSPPALPSGENSPARETTASSPGFKVLSSVRGRVPKGSGVMLAPGKEGLALENHGAQIFVFRSELALDAAKFGEVAKNLDPAIVRAKGYLYLDEKSSARYKYLFQYAGGSPRLSSRDWEKNEKKESALAFFGQGFDQASLEEALRACEVAG